MNKIQIAYERGYRVTKDGDLLNPKGKVIGDCLDSRGYKQTSIKINKKNTNIQLIDYKHTKNMAINYLKMVL